MEGMMSEVAASMMLPEGLVGQKGQWRLEYIQGRIKRDLATSDIVPRLEAIVYTHKAANTRTGLVSARKSLR
jgi:hypothetical protein